MKKILMLAAENGVIPSAKVGGMADVIGDLPAALHAQGVSADIIMPSYGFLAESINGERLSEFQLVFAGSVQRVELFCAPHPEVDGSKIYFIELPDEKAASLPQQIYSQGAPDRPFADDANKFALFCLCVATVLKDGLLPMPVLVHLHDWHSSIFAILSRYDRRFSALKQLPLVYSVHNLAIQGTRPLRDDSSCMEAWFPELLSQLSSEQLNQIVDPRYPHCINPMRAGINLCDRVHLVSPSYAEEVLRPSDHRRGFFGGEGLELDLQKKQARGELKGILNACVYDEFQSVAKGDPKNASWCYLLSVMEQALLKWQADKRWVSSLDQIALTRIAGLWRQSIQVPETDTPAEILVTSVGRLTDQKLLILRQKVISNTGRIISVLESLLEVLFQKKPSGLFILLGSGDEAIADEFRTVAAKYSNFIFLNGYDELTSKLLYESGDLFLMPSSFEPCGISQMLAMREGQLCLVHGVGGLNDTVIDNQSGYCFFGESLVEQATNLLQRFCDALDDFNGEKWMAMEGVASQKRFDWASSAIKYKHELYLFE